MILLLYEPTRSAWTNRDVWPFDNYIALIEFDASCPIAVYTEYIRIHGSNAQRRDCTHTIFVFVVRVVYYVMLHGRLQKTCLLYWNENANALAQHFQPHTPWIHVREMRSSLHVFFVYINVYFKMRQVSVCVCVCVDCARAPSS